MEAIAVTESSRISQGNKFREHYSAPRRFQIRAVGSERSCMSRRRRWSRQPLYADLMEWGTAGLHGSEQVADIVGLVGKNEVDRFDLASDKRAHRIGVGINQAFRR